VRAVCAWGLLGAAGALCLVGFLAAEAGFLATVFLGAALLDAVALLDVPALFLGVGLCFMLPL